MKIFINKLFHKTLRDRAAQDQAVTQEDQTDVATLTIRYKDGLITAIGTVGKVDVYSAFSDFEEWWNNETTPSYVFLYDSGKSMILRESISKYNIDYKFTTAPKPKELVKCPVVSIK